MGCIIDRILSNRSPQPLLIITMVMGSDHHKLLQDRTVTHSHNQVSTTTLLKVMLISVRPSLINRLTSVIECCHRISWFS